MALHLQPASTAIHFWRTIRLPIAFVVSFVAQVMLYRSRAPLSSTIESEYLWIGIVLWAYAIALWYPAARERPATAQLADHIAAAPVRWNWAFGAMVLGGVAYWAASQHLYTPLLVFAWVVSSTIWSLAMLGHGPQTAFQKAKSWLHKHLTTLDFSSAPYRLSALGLGVLAIWLAGACVRFYEIHDVPRDMTSDHVEELIDINKVFAGQPAIFFSSNTGREPLQIYLTVALMRYLDLPLSHLALKVGTALAGTITLIFVFLLARELGGAEAGLWAMLLAAITRWPIALSRMGLRPPLAPLVAAPAFYFLVRGLKSGRRSDFVWAGILVGVGLHGYTAFRMVPLVIALVIGLWLVWQWREQKRNALGLMQNGLVLLLTALVVCIPLLRYALDAPEQFWFRTITRLGDTQSTALSAQFNTLWQNVYATLLMFNFTRDRVWTTTMPDQPIFSPMLAGLFGLGIVSLLVQAIRRDHWALLTLICWFCLLLPSSLSLAFPDENPSVVRVSAALPFVFLIAAWPLTLIRQIVARNWPSNLGRWIALVGPLLIVGYVGRVELHDYFVTFRHAYAGYAMNASEVSQVIQAFLRAGGLPNQAWLIKYPYWQDSRAVSIEAFGNLEWNNVVEPGTDIPAVEYDGEPRLFVLNLYDRQAILKLRELYPQGRLAYQRSQIPYHDFLSYWIPGAVDIDASRLPTLP